MTNRTDLRRARALNNLAVDCAAQGLLDEAIVLLERSIEIIGVGLGQRALTEPYAVCMLNLSALHARAGREAAARRCAVRALEESLRDAVDGPHGICGNPQRVHRYGR